MKIVMIGQKGIPAGMGGIERHVDELSRLLVKQGHHVTVYNRAWYSHTLARSHNGVEIVFRPSIRTKHLDAISHTFFCVLHAVKHDFDIIHFHGVGPALLSWMPRLFAPKIKVVTTFHCIDRRQEKWGIIAKGFLLIGEWCAVTFAHEVITVSKALHTYCLSKYKRESVYIPNGFSTFPSLSSTEELDILRSFGLEKQEYVLAVSRLIPHKGLHHLMLAFARLQTSKKLVIVGSGHFTKEYEKTLQTLADSDERICLLGEQSDLNALATLFKHAYLFVHPSVADGLPIAVLEAFSHERAVLAGDIPEVRELIDDEQFLFQAGDVVDLEHKLAQLLSQPELVEKFGKAGRKHVLAHYNWDTIAQQVETVYNNGGA